ncbi:MAG: S9 family peptidase [Phycisphaerales bacterium]|nr:S9 family peptidase [Phycisphaerales bacterium]
MTLLTLVCVLPASILLAAVVPPTKEVPVVETVHGVEITDEYRWLESLEKDSADVAAWTTTQNDATRATLEALSCRSALASALEPWMTLGSIGLPTMTDAGIVYRQRLGTQNQPVVMFRASLTADARTLLDVNAMDAKGLTSLDWSQPNEQGTLLAYGTSRQGSEMSELHVLDIASGKALTDAITGKVQLSGWMPEGKSFFYSGLRDAKDPYSRETRYHVLGNDPATDKVLEKQTTPSEIPSSAPSSDGKWIIGTLSKGWQANDLWIAPMDLWLKTGELKKTVLAEGIDGRFEPIDTIGDTLYITMSFGTPKGSVMAINLHHPERAAWKTTIAERNDMVMDRVSFAKDSIVVTYSKDVCTQFERFAIDGTSQGGITLPGLGTASISTDIKRADAFVQYTSYDAAPTIFATNVHHPKLTEWAKTSVPSDLSKYLVEQKRATSPDGTQVPMFIVRKRDLVLDGNNPTLLYAYGGFNVSLTPSFNPTIVPWLEQGGVYVVANLRGGGEYGEDWHAAGMQAKKQNVFDDFYACAEWLIENKYTQSARLAIEGGSNGGLLTGVAATQRPDLFSAAIVAVPLLDMVRYHQFLIARYWVPEYGSSEDMEAFATLYAYSPYHNIKSSIKYPALLITAGENDSRVHPLHARKFAAKLQRDSANDLATEPILLWVDRDAGHGQGKPLALRIRDEVDQWSFVMWQTGVCK